LTADHNSVIHKTKKGKAEIKAFTSTHAEAAEPEKVYIANTEADMLSRRMLIVQYKMGQTIIVMAQTAQT
jgi:hypothetical protein